MLVYFFLFKVFFNGFVLMAALLVGLDLVTFDGAFFDAVADTFFNLISVDGVVFLDFFTDFTGISEIAFPFANLALLFFFFGVGSGVGGVT